MRWCEERGTDLGGLDRRTARSFHAALDAVPDDAPAVDHKRVIRERAMRLDRNDPAGIDAQIAGLHA